MIKAHSDKYLSNYVIFTNCYCSYQDWNINWHNR